MLDAPKVEYLLCQKGGYHYGESLNMVCLQASCLDQMLCCCACIEQHHKQHNAKPLRLLLLQASKSVLSMTPSIFDIDMTLQIINCNLKQSIENFSAYKKSVQSRLDAIENAIIAYYAFMVEQVKLKNIDPKAQVERAFQNIQTNALGPKEYVYSVKRIAGLLSVKKQEKPLTENDILASLNSATTQLKKSIATNMQEIVGKIDGYLNTLSQFTINGKFWKDSAFKFSPTLKHPEVKLISDQIVKATNTSGYKFALMSQSLQTGDSVKDFSFSIKQSSSNWIAVGMCHKNIVGLKNYGFNFSAIGHGAYMVSSNGGSWSNIKADQNNTIKAFKFTKGDTICVRVNFKDNNITFKRNNDKYVIDYQLVPGDELYPCVLFYYMNDEVEFLPNYKF